MCCVFRSWVFFQQQRQQWIYFDTSATTFLSFDASHCLNQRATFTVAVNGTLNVTQDTVGNILLGGIRREVTIWLQNMMAILLSICLNVWHLKPTSLIVLFCMSNVIVPSPIIGNRDFSGVWVVRLMSYADAITCPLSLPIHSMRSKKVHQMQQMWIICML